jgi:two-component system, chemotaxis family, protein-glutamate methylesterase/glutaminase
VLNILIVDDSITYRAILSNVLKEISFIHIVGTASSGKSALMKLALEPIDLVLLDIEMPDMDGLETLKAIKSQFPAVKVVMVSGTNRQSTDITIRALEAGALDFVPKPDHKLVADNIEALKSQLTPIFQTVSCTLELTNPAPDALSTQTETAPHQGNAVPTIPPDRTLETISKQAKRLPLLPIVDVVVIGISTGGPNSLGEFLPALPGNLGVPILIVQHMPPVFTASLASSLDKKCTLTVKEAEADEPVLANTVYIAPGGMQMAVKSSYGQKFIALSQTAPPENSCKPAVDYLFRSVGESYKKNILAIVMTGMGHDGVKGVEALSQIESCYCMTQTEESCVIYGMPKAVDLAGLSDEKVSLSRLANRVSELCLSHSAIRMK